MNKHKLDFKKYYKYLKTMEIPIMPSQLPNIKIDLQALSKYTQSKCVKIMDLSEEERQMFINKKGN